VQLCRGAGQGPACNTACDNAPNPGHAFKPGWPGGGVVRCNKRAKAGTRASVTWEQPESRHSICRPATLSPSEMYTTCCPTNHPAALPLHITRCACPPWASQTWWACPAWTGSTSLHTQTQHQQQASVANTTNATTHHKPLPSQTSACTTCRHAPEKAAIARIRVAKMPSSHLTCVCKAAMGRAVRSKAARLPELASCCVQQRTLTLFVLGCGQCLASLSTPAPGRAGHSFRHLPAHSAAGGVLAGPHLGWRHRWSAAASRPAAPPRHAPAALGAALHPQPQQTLANQRQAAACTTPTGVDPAPACP
jgi:hypothetical protein